MLEGSRQCTIFCFALAQFDYKNISIGSLLGRMLKTQMI